MGVVRTVVLFVLAAAAELGGTWLVWQGIRGNRGWLWAGGGFLALAFYGLIVTFQGESSFGRIMAAYGGLFIAGALAWGIVADGYRPDHWDLIGRVGEGFGRFPCCAAFTPGKGPCGPGPDVSAASPERVGVL